jgi:hypothetical protein
MNVFVLTYIVLHHHIKSYKFINFYIILHNLK